MTTRQIRLRRRPVGAVTRDCFAFVDAAMPDLDADDILRRTIYLSLDPYMRGWMDDHPLSYAPPIVPVPEGAVMIGGTVSEVLESRDPQFLPGDYVLGRDGWQQYAVSGQAATAYSSSMPPCPEAGHQPHCTPAIAVSRCLWFARRWACRSQKPLASVVD